MPNGASIKINHNNVDFIYKSEDRTDGGKSEKNQPKSINNPVGPALFCSVCHYNDSSNP